MDKRYKKVILIKDIGGLEDIESRNNDELILPMLLRAFKLSEETEPFYIKPTTNNADSIQLPDDIYIFNHEKLATGINYEYTQKVLNGKYTYYALVTTNTPLLLTGIIESTLEEVRIVSEVTNHVECSTNFSDTDNVSNDPGPFLLFADGSSESLILMQQSLIKLANEVGFYL